VRAWQFRPIVCPIPKNVTYLCAAAPHCYLNRPPAHFRYYREYNLEALLWFIVICMAVFFHTKMNKLERQLRWLHRELADLKVKPAGATVPAPMVAPVPEARPAMAAATVATSAASDSSPLDRIYQPPPKRQNEFLKKILAAWPAIEKQIVANWTGILGVLAVVVGVAYLGIYAALQMPPLGRFFLMLGFAGGLYATAEVLARKEYWRELAFWLRSGAGAVALLTCVGASAFEDLRWVTDPVTGLAVLSFGIAANMYLVLSARRQIFASLHVIICLAALSIAPQTLVILMLGALVALGGLWTVHRDEKWVNHLIGTVLAFTFFNILWRWDRSLAREENILAAICVFAVSMAALAIHYKKIFAAEKWNSLHHRAHVITWVAAGLNLALYSRGSQVGPLLLAGASLVTWWASQRSHKAGIEWLFVTDRFVSFLLAVFAVISLNRFEIGWTMIASLALTVAILFLFIFGWQKNRRLTLGGLFAFYFLFAAWMGISIYEMGLGARPVLEYLGVLCIPLLTLAAGHQYIRDGHKEFLFPIRDWNGRAANSSFLGLCLQVGLLLPFMFALYLGEGLTQSLGAVAILLMSMGLRFGLRSLTYEMASVPVQGLMVLFLGSGLFFSPLDNQMLITLAGLIVWAGVNVNMPFHRESQISFGWLYIYLAGFVFLAGAYLLARPLSILLPGMIWLLGAQGCFYLWFRSEPDSASPGKFYLKTHPLLGVGFAILAAYLVRHVFFELTEFKELYGFRLSSFGQIYALMITGQVVWAARRSARNPWTQSFLELSLAAYVIFVFSNFTAGKSFLMHSLAAIALWLLQPAIPEFKRLAKYSFILFLVALFQLAFVASTAQQPANFWLNETWVWGLAGVSILTTYVAMVHKQRARTADQFRDGDFLGKQFRSVGDRMNSWLILPLLIGIGFFLFWSFDKTVLSILWMLELFALFLMSLWLREHHFRSVAMGGIVVLVIRMLFYDLRGQDFFVKAVVFLAVGGLLLGMNTIYGRFKHRFEEG